MAGKKWVFLFDEVNAAEKYMGGDWDKVQGAPGRQRCQSGGYDPHRAAGSALLYRHHRSVQCLPGRRGTSSRPGCGTRCLIALKASGGTFREKIWRSDQSPPGFLPFRRKILHAGHDGYRPQHWSER